MAKLFKIVFAISKVLHGIAAIALTLMIAVTVVDVFLRTIGQAVVGAYEVIGMICGPLVVGFAVPLSSWNKKHISMDIVLSRLSLPEPENSYGGDPDYMHPAFLLHGLQSLFGR